MKINSRLEKEIDSASLGEMVMEHLRRLDQVAYVRFASVYRQFKDVNQFVDELKGLLDMEAHDLNELRKLQHRGE
jgi:transcriptional repressor NrdR